ncbi:MAG TPA: hypothetical protein VG692_06445 [Gemmatimonadales bacterium]|nr:hypothetical protein [Gemmatimonadales bacterium]
MSKSLQYTLMAAALVTVAACSDSSTSSDGGTPPSGLTVLRLTGTAPALCGDSTGAWFVKDPNGQDQEIALVFPETGDPGDCTLGQTHDFLRLKLKKISLLRRPDNTLISDGDSVFISVKWVGNDSILFDMRPSGLLFDPANPAELHIEYGEAGDDLNHDGRVDGEDSVVETKLDIWRQERPGDPFFRVGTAKSEDNNEIEARLNGFSRFALAY